MGTSTVDRTDAAPRPGAEHSAPPPGRSRWRRDGRTAKRTAQAQLVEELEVELALLREENARLKVTRQRARDRPVNERVRELLPLGGEGGAAEGEPWELLTNCLLLRDGLIDACREIELGIHETRQRLEVIAPGAERGRHKLLGRPTAREDIGSAA
jgi:hypothetical protein